MQAVGVEICIHDVIGRYVNVCILCGCQISGMFLLYVHIMCQQLEYTAQEAAMYGTRGCDVRHKSCDVRHKRLQCTAQEAAMYGTRGCDVLS